MKTTFCLEKTRCDRPNQLPDVIPSGLPAYSGRLGGGEMRWDGATWQTSCVRRLHRFISRDSSQYTAPMATRNATPTKRASFAKTLPHNDVGEVDLNAYGAFVAVLSSGEPLTASTRHWRP